MVEQLWQSCIHIKCGDKGCWENPEGKAIVLPAPSCSLGIWGEEGSLAVCSHCACTHQGVQPELSVCKWALVCNLSYPQSSSPFPT